MRNTNLLISLISVFALAACSTATIGEPEPTPTPDPATPTTLSRLQDGLDLRFLPEGSNLGVQVVWNQGGESVVSSAQLTLASGGLHLSADESGVVRVQSMDLELGDLLISSDQLASDIELVDISVHQKLAQDCDINDWSVDGDSVSTWVQAGLALDWSMLRNGNVIPLGEQDLVEIPMQLEIHKTDDGLAVSLSADAEGLVWSWLGAIELRDLHLEINADEVGPVE
jgi:hypothetical protein